MAQTYSIGRFARTVDAGGEAGFMNLGYADDPSHPGSTVRRQRRMAALILDVVAPPVGQLVLDVGCGKGGMANLIGRRFPGTQVTGVNIDPAQLATARRQAVGGVRLVAAEAERLPFAPGTFDTAYAVELLSHIEDKEALAGELARVLRPGGRLVLAVIVLNQPYEQFTPDEQAHLVRTAELFNERPEDIPTSAVLGELFARAGIHVTESRDLSRGVFQSRHETFLRMLCWLRHRNPLRRAAFGAVAALRWRLRAAEFARFLAVNTAMHPDRFYEYHLVTLVNNAERTTRP